MKPSAGGIDKLCVEGRKSIRNRKQHASINAVSSIPSNSPNAGENSAAVRRIESVRLVNSYKSEMKGELVLKQWQGSQAINKLSKTSDITYSRQGSNHSTDCVVDEDCVFYGSQPEEVIETTRGICRDYICYRLKRAGFRGRVVITKYPPAKDQALSFEILKIGRTFEELYPHLFRHLARQLGYILRSDEELRVLFERLAIEVIGPDPHEYRWGRVLALLAIAGSLAVDCIAQGHVELVENVVTVFSDFIEANLLHWIIDHAGWDGMLDVLQMKKDNGEPSLSLSLRENNLWIVATTGFVIITGLILSMGTLSKTLSIYEYFH